MPWKESTVMEERLRFVARLLDGEPMTDLCREFGISRKAGYKVFSRYREYGCGAFSDRSRRPVHYAETLQKLAAAFGNFHLLAKLERVVVSNYDFGSLHIVEHVAGDEFAASVIVVEVIRLQDA
jgi:transposase-like protein